MSSLPVTERDPSHQREFVKKRGWLARFYGLSLIALGALFIDAPFPNNTAETCFDIVGLAFVIYGSADVLTGKHHILPVAISYLISDYLEDRATPKKPE